MPRLIKTCKSPQSHGWHWRSWQRVAEESAQGEAKKAIVSDTRCAEKVNCELIIILYCYTENHIQTNLGQCHSTGIGAVLAVHSRGYRAFRPKTLRERLQFDGWSVLSSFTRRMSTVNLAHQLTIGFIYTEKSPTLLTLLESYYNLSDNTKTIWYII